MNPGDWIRRKGSHIIPFHHGIYIGSNHVVHASGDTLRVEVAPFDLWAKGREVFLVKSAPIHKEFQIVQRAMSMVGKKFSMSGLNCEHLASYAFNGEGISTSIKTGITIVILSIAGILLLVKE